MPYLLDTNVVTQLLKRNPGVVEKYRRTLELGEQVYLSAVVYYEIKRGLPHLGATKQLRQLDEDFKDVLYWAPVSDATTVRARVGRPCRRGYPPVSLYYTREFSEK